MKNNTECFKNFKIMVDAFHGIQMLEGWNFKVFGSGDIGLIGEMAEMEELMDFYHDAWMCALTCKKL